MRGAAVLALETLVLIEVFAKELLRHGHLCCVAQYAEPSIEYIYLPSERQLRESLAIYLRLAKN